MRREAGGLRDRDLYAKILDIQAPWTGADVELEPKGEEVRVHEMHVEVLYDGRVELEVERLVRRDGARIQYRHVIHTLVRKPGALKNFEHASGAPAAPSSLRAADFHPIFRGQSRFALAALPDACKVVKGWIGRAAAPFFLRLSQSHKL